MTTPPPETSDAGATTEERFVELCKEDYCTAEITAVGYQRTAGGPFILLFGVVELLHPYLEPDPFVGLGSNEDGYPRRHGLGDHGSLIIQRWHLPVSDAIDWYRACATGIARVPRAPVPGMSEVTLPPMDQDPIWPGTVVEVDPFWEGIELWGNRPGKSRSHRLLPITPIDPTAEWTSSIRARAEEWIRSALNIDLLARSVLMGSVHLRLPNPLFSDPSVRQEDGARSLKFEIPRWPHRMSDPLTLVVWNRRPWGASSDARTP